MFGHKFEREAGSDGGRAGGKGDGVELADEGDVAHREFPFLGGEVVVVEAEGFLENGVVGGFGDGEQNRIGVAHVVAADDVGGVGEAARVFVVGGAEEGGGGVNRAGGDDDDIGGVGFFFAVAFDFDFGDGAAGGVGVEALDQGVGQQGDIGVLQGGVDADGLRIGLGIDEAGVAVAGGAADAGAFAFVLFIEANAEGDVKGLMAELDEVIVKLLDARLVGDCRVWIGAGGVRIGGVFAAVAMDLVEGFSLLVIGFEIVVGDGPGGRDAAVVNELAEIFAAEAEEGRAVEFGVAADIVVGVGVEFFAIFVAPDFFGVVFGFDVDGVGGPIFRLARDVVAAFDEEDALAGGSKAIGEGAAAGAGADDDYVVVGGGGHGFLS